MSDPGTQPLVSVVCLTYNQEKYIAQTLDGFLAQQTSFPFEIIVHDDASRDKTFEIVDSYRERHPNLIRVIRQSENQYSQGTSLPALVFKHARAPFIAYCEGDDFWVDPLKLQVQADYLTENPKVGLVFTDANIFYENRNLTIHAYGRTTKKHIPTGDVRKTLLTSYWYKTCTSMFRADLVQGYEQVALKLRARMEDYVMWLTIAGKSDVGYLDRPTTTYRVRAESASHFTNLTTFLRFRRSALKVTLYFNRLFGNLVDRSTLRDLYRKSIVEHCLQIGEYGKAFRMTRSMGEFAVQFMKVTMRSAALKIPGSWRLLRSNSNVD